jgi:tetratricopeptide (TPR) repeat protein
MTKFLPSFLLFFLINTTHLFAQKTCECITYKKDLDSLMDVSPTESNYKFVDKLRSSSEYICQVKGFMLRANMLFIKKELDSALNDVLTVMEMLKKNKCPETALMNPYRLAANIYDNISDYDNAIEYSLKALEIIEKSKNSYEAGEGNFAVAQIFNNMKQYDKGLAYCRKVAPYINNLPDSIDKIILLNKTASIHLNYYQIYKNQNSLDTSFHCASVALKFAKKINDVNAGDERIRAWLTLCT